MQRTWSGDLPVRLGQRPIRDDAAVLAEPERNGQLILAAVRRREIARERAVEPSLVEPRCDLIAGEAEPAVRLALAQELQAVRREIDHQQTPARRDQASRLADRPRRIVKV